MATAVWQCEHCASRFHLRPGQVPPGNCPRCKSRTRAAALVMSDEELAALAAADVAERERRNAAETQAAFRRAQEQANPAREAEAEAAPRVAADDIAESLKRLERTVDACRGHLATISLGVQIWTTLLVLALLPVVLLIVAIVLGGLSEVVRRAIM